MTPTAGIYRCAFLADAPADCIDIFAFLLEQLGADPVR
jgi:hypothetical protein